MSIFQELPEYDKLVKAKWDGKILKGLGTVKELKHDYDEALQLYSDTLRRGSNDADLWNMLQRVYTLQHGSDEGYFAFVERLEQTFPSENHANEVGSILGKDFPNFSLNTINGEPVQFADLKGKIESPTKTRFLAKIRYLRKIHVNKNNMLRRC